MFGELDRERGPFAQLTLKKDLSVMKLNDFLNEGQANPETFEVSEGFGFVFEITCEDLLQGLVGDPNPGIHDPGVSKSGIVMEVHMDPSALAVILDGIGEKIVKKLTEFLFGTPNDDRVRRKLNMKGDLVFPGQGFDGGARKFDNGRKIDRLKSRASFWIPNSAKSNRLSIFFPSFNKFL